MNVFILFKDVENLEKTLFILNTSSSSCSKTTAFKYRLTLHRCLSLLPLLLLLPLLEFLPVCGGNISIFISELLSLCLPFFLDLSFIPSFLFFLSLFNCFHQLMNILWLNKDIDRHTDVMEDNSSSFFLFFPHHYPGHKSTAWQRLSILLHFSTKNTGK